MRATFDPSKLRDAFGLAASVAPARSPKEVLQSVLLTVGPDGAAVEATDLEYAIRARVDMATIDRPGSALLPTARFAAILKAWGGDPLLVSLDGGVLSVGEGRAAYKLNVADAALFPSVVDGVNASISRDVDAGELATALTRTAVACDPGSVRYALGGVLFEAAQADVLTRVGTDGRRLARTSIAAPGEAVEGKDSTVLPMKAARLLTRCLPDSGPTSLRWDKRGMSIEFDGFTVFSRLVEGRYPRWGDVFPAGVASRVAFPAGDLRTAIQQAAVTTGEETRGVRFGLSRGGLSLSASAADAGESEVSIDCDYDGPDVAIALAPEYCLDMLRVLDAGEAVVMSVIDGKAGVVFETEDGAYSYVVMPMTLDR